MNLVQIAWRNMQQRGLSSLLTLVSLALGTALTVTVLALYGIVQDAFLSNTSVGYNLVVGAKGSPLQLTLNTVFYLSRPIETIPYKEYLEYLPQDERQRQAEMFGGEDVVDTDRDGKFAPFMMGGFAIPVALGDYFGPYRVVGTNPEFFRLLRYGPDLERKFEFAQGRNFVTDDPQHGPYTAVVGSQVAKEMHVGLGDSIDPSHGDPEGHGHGVGFTIVGVLAPTGTPNDRAAFINLEGFYRMEGHARAIDPEAESDQEGTREANVPAEAGVPQEAGVPEEAGVPDDEGEPDAESASKGEGTAAESLSFEPLPIRQRDLTAILLRAEPMFAVRMEKTITKSLRTQAASPIREITNLLDIIVQPLMVALLAITVITCVVAAVGILVSIYNSMNDRKRDIAVMRALGARRDTVLAVILLESLLIAVGGAAIGWFLAHLGIYAAGGLIEEKTGVQVGLLTVTSTELWVIPLVLGLAALAGLLPALVGYRTDVAKNL